MSIHHVLLPERSPSRALVSHILTCIPACLRWLTAGLLAAACAADPDGSREAVPIAAAPTQHADAQVSYSPQVDAGIALDPVRASAPAASATDVGPSSDPNRCGGTVYKAQAKELEILVLFDNSVSMLLPGGRPRLPEHGCDRRLLREHGRDALGHRSGRAERVRARSQVGRDLAGAQVLRYANATRPSTPRPTSAWASCPSTRMRSRRVSRRRLPLAETATRPALEGALAHTRARAKTPGFNARQIILLVTDGFPDEADCNDNTVDATARIAAMGNSGDPAIATYVFVTVPEVALDPVAERRRHGPRQRRRSQEGGRLARRAGRGARSGARRLTVRIRAPRGLLQRGQRSDPREPDT